MQRILKNWFLRSELPVLVDFYSDSCIPCKRWQGSVGDIEDDYEGKLNVYKVNVNFDEGTCFYNMKSCQHRHCCIANKGTRDRKELQERQTIDALLGLFEGINN